MDGKKIVKHIEALVEACKTIEDAGACDKCPLHKKKICLEYSLLEEFEKELRSDDFDNFYGLADDIEEYANFNEEDERFDREYQAWKDREVDYD